MILPFRQQEFPASSQQLMQFITNILQSPKKLSLIKTKPGETKNMNQKKRTQGSQTRTKTTKIHSSGYPGHPSWSLPRLFPCVWPPDFSTQPAMTRTEGGDFPMAASRITYSVSGPPDSKSKAFPGHPLEKEGNLLYETTLPKKNGFGLVEDALKHIVFCCFFGVSTCWLVDISRLLQSKS